MPNAVARWLGEQAALSEIQFLTEFPAQNKAVPLRRATVAVGLGSVQITDKFVEGDDGVLERQEYCRSAAIRLRLGIHVPFSEGGDRCHEIFTLVLDMLTFASDLNLRASGCREVTAHRDTDAFVMEAWADVAADFCPAESTGLPLASFLPKDLLCGSHIGNGDIHLTAAQKERLDAPFRAGTYMGTGAATASINIGARPYAVFVSALEMPPAHPNFGAAASQVYFGFAANSGNSMGVELTSTGFRLRMGSQYAVGTTSPALNAGGTQYMYFALV
jgi:hypothetical protein